MTKGECLEVAEKIADAFKRGYVAGMKAKSEELSPLIEKLADAFKRGYVAGMKAKSEELSPLIEKLVVSKELN